MPIVVAVVIWLEEVAMRFLLLRGTIMPVMRKVAEFGKLAAVTRCHFIFRECFAFMVLGVGGLLWGRDWLLSIPLKNLLVNNVSGLFCRDPISQSAHGDVGRIGAAAECYVQSAMAKDWLR